MLQRSCWRRPFGCFFCCFSGGQYLIVRVSFVRSYKSCSCAEIARRFASWVMILFLTVTPVKEKSLSWIPFHFILGCFLPASEQYFCIFGTKKILTSSFRWRVSFEKPCTCKLTNKPLDRNAPIAFSSQPSPVAKILIVMCTMEVLHSAISRLSVCPKTLQSPFLILPLLFFFVFYLTVPPVLEQSEKLCKT